MIQDRSIAIAIANSYWAAHLGCETDELFAKPFHVLTHGGELMGYNGVFALFRGDAVMVSLPPDSADSLRARLADLHQGCTPASLKAALSSIATKIIGPAFIGYAETMLPPLHQVRAIGPEDVAAVQALEQSCDATEWEHGGSSFEVACSGVFAGDQLVALAGYEVWGGGIAHISIITHPAFRGQGLGRSAVAHLALRALDTGLLPQYRTLESNGPSIRVAETLGFQAYATSVAARLPPADRLMDRLDGNTVKP